MHICMDLTRGRLEKKALFDTRASILLVAAGLFSEYAGLSFRIQSKFELVDESVDFVEESLYSGRYANQTLSLNNRCGAACRMYDIKGRTTNVLFVHRSHRLEESCNGCCLCSTKIAPEWQVPLLMAGATQLVIDLRSLGDVVQGRRS